MSEVGRMKVRRIPMGVEGIWGGTSWISLRSVHFLEVYIKPKKKKEPCLKVLKGLPTLYSDEDMPPK